MRAVLLLALVLAGCAQAPAATWQALHTQTMEELAAGRTEGHFDPFLVPYVTEAAAVPWMGANQWPADHPVGLDLSIPDGPYLATLRPAYARMRANFDNAAVRDDVIAVALRGLNGTQFGDPRLLNDDIAAILVLGTASSNPSEGGWRPALLALAANQTGGWAWRSGGEAETDMTGLALFALSLVAGGLDVIDTHGALASIAAARNGDGGYGLTAGAASNCDSTVWAIRAHLALDAPVPAAAWSYLASLRVPGGWALAPGQAANALCSVEVATLFAVAAETGLPVPSGFSFER